MGLDVTYDCWHGAYSAFARWRHGLAQVAGYAVWPVVHDWGGGLNVPRDTVMVDWGHLGTPQHLAGDWEVTPDDPLLVLIIHSDCEGVIRAAQCGPLADRLEELLPLLPIEPDSGHIGDWGATTRKFIEGLRAAAADGADVEFG